MTPFEPLRLAELLISRLCHDLITPIGAINTGLELFQETSWEHHTESKEILNLILQSATTAAARLSFFRAAFGSSRKTLPFEEMKELIENYFAHNKITYHWKNSSQKNPLFEKRGRLLLNSVLWMSDCAPRGGTLSINFSEEGSPLLFLSLKAESLIIHQGTLEALEGQLSLQDLTPRTVPCYLVNYLLKAEEDKLILQHNPSSSELSLEIKIGNVK